MLKIPERIISPYTSRDMLGLNRVCSGSMLNSSNINALNRITSDLSGQMMGNAVQNPFGQALPGGMGNAVQSAMVMTAMQGMGNMVQNTPYQNYPHNMGNYVQNSPYQNVPQNMGNAVQNTPYQNYPQNTGNAVQNTPYQNYPQNIGNAVQNTPYQNYPQNTGNAVQNTPYQNYPQNTGNAVQNTPYQNYPQNTGNVVQNTPYQNYPQNTGNAVQNTPYQNYPQNTGNTVQNTPVHTAPPIVNKPMPSFSKPMQKGMKVPLFPQGNVSPIKAGIGWKINDSRCDVDASAFLLGANEKVISEDWFVFYSQPQSPDRSIVYNQSDPVYQKSFDIDLNRLNSDVQKIVFVVTIDEALKRSLNFGMLRDVYLKLTDTSGNELLSFCLSDYYSNVTSMMIGEIYKNKGQWKFNAIGNGIARDLEGLCNFYGIEVI